LKQEQNIPGAVAASAKRCLCAIIHIENFQIKNPLNSSLKKPKHYTYAAAQGHKLRLTAMAATTAGKSDGYRNRT
jgi:hypothetical protein